MSQRHCLRPDLSAASAYRWHGCRCPRCLAYFNERRAAWRSKQGEGQERERVRHRERLRDRRAAGEKI